MPTVIGHSLFAIGLFGFRPMEEKLLQTLLLSILCSCIPDIDVISFEFGIQYSSMLGHRGFTHSVLFACLMGVTVTYFFYPEFKDNPAGFLKLSCYFFMCTASHGLLDAMTNGGQGVGFFIPFTAERYFFPIRPLPVSPIRIEFFYTAQGWQIIMAELKFIGILCLSLVAASIWIKR